MRLIASVIVRNELARYLQPCIEHLLEFCDEIRILDDGSTDDWHTTTSLINRGRVWIKQNDGGSFFRHEGAARQHLLNWTLAGDPTHILAIDADELVGDGPALRRIMEASSKPVFALCMTEVWGARPDALDIRCDGGWHPGRSPCAFAVPPIRTRKFAINPKPLACGREPVEVRSLYHLGQAASTDIDIYHFGWANPAERASRYARYVQHDGGRYHRNAHLESIMWPDDKVHVDPRPWPAALQPYRPMILDRMRSWKPPADR